MNYKNRQSEPSSPDISKIDPGMATRNLSGWTRVLVCILGVGLSIFHVYTAGFGVLLELKHRSVHLTFVLALIFLLFPTRRTTRRVSTPERIIYMDALSSLLIGFILAVSFGELLHVSTPMRWAVFLVGVFTSLYLRRRETWRNPWNKLSDLSISIIGLIIWLHFVRDGIIPSANWTKALQFWSFSVGLATLVCLLLIAWRGISPRSTSYTVSPIDFLLAILAAAAASYVAVDFLGIVARAGLPIERELLWGGLAILMVFEATNRTLGPDLSLLGILALAYAYAGPYLENIPILSFFAHRGYGIERIVEHMILGTEGLFGIPLGVVATYVFHFVLFGILVMRTGLGQLFIDTAIVLTGRSRGGPAKVAILASGFFGSISGSSIANTVTTGTLTIPLMRRLGYSGQYAAAVEATASTGGQITPPIMGAAAFIMAEFLNIPYLSIATCAILPALYYYLGIGTMVHLEAVKKNIQGLRKDELPNLKATFVANGWMLLPMGIIIALLIRGMSPFLSAFWATLLTISLSQAKNARRPLLIPALVSVPLLLWPNSFTTFQWEWVFISALLWFFFRSGHAWAKWAAGGILVIEGLLIQFSGPLLAGVAGNLLVPLTAWIANGFESENHDREPTQLGLRDTVIALESGARNALSIGAACACVGIVIGTASLTGFGLKFAQGTTLLAEFMAKGLAGWGLLYQSIDPLSVQVFITLFLTMIACSMLGSGLPTTATYIILITFTAPALNQLGIPLLAAHMFILYYGVLSDVIPPVALSAYAGAALAREDPFKTGFTAIRLAGCGIIVPFVFVYNTDLLLLPWLGLVHSPKAYPLAAAIISTALGIMIAGSALTGYLIKKNRWYEGVGLAFGAILLVCPSWSTVLIGLILSLGIGFAQRIRR